MGKKLSLLERLENAISITSSETEKDDVYLLFYETGRKALENECEVFYGEVVDYQSMIPSVHEATRENDEKISKGKELAQKIKNAVILPEASSKHYGAKYKRAREKEHQLLVEFYKREKNGESIQS